MKYAINYLKCEIEKLKYIKKETLRNQVTLRKLYTDSIDSMTKAIKHLRQVNQKCEWVDKNTLYKTNCGNITNIDPDKFCPFCGREIKEKVMS
jgi:wobble nucleotide-excising tRNase